MDPAAINEQIDRILRSQSFASKSQLRKLLEVLHKNMDSPAALTTELVIRELWPTETKTKHAKDVATEMNRLRHVLQAYYGEEGNTDSIVVSLPNRSATARNGAQEKRWIVAESRDEAARRSSTDAQEQHDAPPVQTNPRAGLNKIAAIVALAAILVVGAYVVVRLTALPDQPRLGRLDGSALVVMNADGKELWRKTFPEGFETGLYSQFLHEGAWFADLEGKGHTSVLFVYSPGKPPARSSTLICYSDQGKEKWRWTPGKALPELEGDSPIFKTFALGILKATDKKPPCIVASSAHAIWWPNQIALLDSNGKVLSEYWHSGRLDSMTLADLDGDGREEIVAAGTNNGYLQATLVVLDPDRVSGASSEVRPQFQIHGMGAAQERTRLLFPRSDMNKAFFSYNSAFGLSVSNSIIRFSVEECIVPGGCTVAYEFAKNLQLIAAYPAEGFRSAHVRLYQNRKDNHPFSPEEQTAFQKVRCLAGCKTEFVVVGKVDPN